MRILDAHDGGLADRPAACALALAGVLVLLVAAAERRVGLDRAGERRVLELPRLADAVRQAPRRPLCDVRVAV